MTQPEIAEALSQFYVWKPSKVQPGELIAHVPVKGGWLCLPEFAIAPDLNLRRREVLAGPLPHRQRWLDLPVLQPPNSARYIK
jgi:hypothetical protein